jgi:Rod binding domain-containing protein
MDSIPKSGESSVSGSAIMNSFGDQAVAQQLSRQGGFGVADALYKDMLKSVLAGTK